ncbi:MAG: phosphotransferase [Saprospiraceae bacterium]|nr:phosphotransferase [Saprospiraceae bacterium]
MQLSFEIHLPAFTNYLQENQWIGLEDHVVAIQKPGEGNMNMVLRAITANGSIILKQANPYVQKYPSIPAPIERVEVEYLFYQLLQQTEALKQYLPNLIGFDAKKHILAVQDLGEGADFTFVYRKGHSFEDKTLIQAIAFLSILHNLEFDANTVRQFPSNLTLRKLNHQHLFVYPFLEDNGFNLDTIQLGLQALSFPYKTDQLLKMKLQTLGDLYLSTGNTLLHGDYYPGSWLNRTAGFKVIDPEFCYFGNAAYDIGIFLAHLKMAQAPAAQIELLLTRYQQPKHFDQTLAFQFAGMEIIRRLIGLAQLPLDLTLEEKAILLEEAKSLILLEM